MSEIFDFVQDLLYSAHPYPDAIFKIRELQKSLDGLDLSRSMPLERLILALNGIEDDKTGIADIAVLIRQILRNYGRRLTIKQELWSWIKSRRHEFGLSEGQQKADHMIDVTADDWDPDWLWGAGKIDQLSQVRIDEPAAGDGLLFALGHWENYQSSAQKLAVQASLNMPPGTTLLASLPTGAGKSLCILLPAWQESQGGRIKGGTTLVIVPTVSLAIDQEVQIERKGFFKQAIDRSFSPASLTSATTDPALLSAIRDGVKYGTLPILFTSPEKIINSEFYDIFLEAAGNGTLNRLIIDEAHLVATWGAGFRTEFQFMATFRRRLLDASKGRLRTILLSGTITKKTESLLRKQFSEGENYSYIRANRLRPEMSYWFNHSNKASIRNEHVLEALGYLPRPLILYVTRPDDADKWIRILHNSGYKRVEAFSGKTANDERLRIINEWNANKRDIMVANSAFGMGVDKGDVRTIIHVTIPENDDRFYQEVGRSGRDGCSSISLVCSADEDEKLARGMTSTARISTEKALARWEKMKTSASFEVNRGDVAWVDPNVRPKYIQDFEESQANQEWNEHTLLLMQRANLVDIEATRSDEAWTNLPEEERKPRLKISLRDLRTLEDKKLLAEAITKTRNLELDGIRSSLKHLKEMVITYASTQQEHCIAHEFGNLYPDTVLACGGCPYCRKTGLPIRPGKVEIYHELHFPRTGTAEYLQASFQALSGWKADFPINVLWDGRPTLSNLKPKLLILSELIKVGCQQLILPGEVIRDSEWFGQLLLNIVKSNEIIPHLIVPWEDILKDPYYPLFPLPSIVVYPLENETANQLFKALDRRLPGSSLRINIVHRALRIDTLGGFFQDNVHGFVMDFTALANSLHTNHELFSF